MPNDIANAPMRAPTPAGFLQDPARPILCTGRDLPPQHGVVPHQHPRSQLLWATQGVLRITSDQAIWVVPPSHAVWIPGNVQHALQSDTAAVVRNLYIDASCPPRRDTACAVLTLTPLMRALILRLYTEDTTAAFPARLLRLCAVTLDEIANLPQAPLHLPGGQDPRLVRLIRHLGHHPDDPSALPELARIAAASPRTLERLFRQETGLTYRQWRSRQRLLLAIERLTLGQSSATIAYALGYRSPSAFTAAFHAEFGTPPQSFRKQTAVT
ncbi:helix-turn-helix transcriptional regulator [Cypionkella sp.]|uniref:AraC family transcriptional regulator n=1 Tax=Cypionkella sp. TaxID=2811411 RepID=UPI0026036592|nr:helix-turn-helix transcriptional regulator [Cypionkella sp.]